MQGGDRPSAFGNSRVGRIDGWSSVLRHHRIPLIDRLPVTTRRLRRGDFSQRWSSHGIASALKESLCDTSALIESNHQCLTGLVASITQSRHLVDCPLMQDDWHENLLVVNRKVVDACRGDAAGMGGEVSDTKARHLETGHLS